MDWKLLKLRYILFIFHLLSIHVYGANNASTSSVPVVTVRPAPLSLQSRTTGQENVCTTVKCYEIARSVRMAMNESVDPCDDFYLYSCGNWSTYNPIPDDQSSWDNMNIVYDKVTAQLREMLEKTDANDISSSRRKARMVYKTCLNLDQMEKLGVSPLLEVLKSTVGGWPLLTKDWLATNFSWLAALKQTAKIGISPFLSWGVFSDDENPRENIVNFYESGLGMGPRKYYFANESGFIRTAYKQLMIDTIILMYNSSGTITTNTTANLKKDADAIYEFEEHHANLKRTAEDWRNITISMNVMTLEKFHNCCLAGSLTLLELIDYMVGIMPTPALKALVNANMTVNIDNPDYFARRHRMLVEKASDPVHQRMLANYFGWKITSSYSSYLTRKLRDLNEAYHRTISGTKKEPERWRTCVDLTNGVMGTAVGSLYIRNFFNKSSKVKVTGLVKDVREAFTVMLKNAEWMDESTRKRGLTKLESMLEYIAYPEYILDNVTRLDKEYENLDFGHGYLENVMIIHTFYKEKNLKELEKKNDRSMDEELPPAYVNAFYMPSMNMIAFVAGILQEPFYGADRPEYLNYGSMGHIIGHEITHGFDDMGSQYDETGNFKDWWSKESRSRYKERSKEMVKLYSSYSVAAGHVNGEVTIGENIADCGGVKEAFNAYRIFTKRTGVIEKLLPGFGNSSVEQLFFLGMAQEWCGIQREEVAKQRLLSDSHSPAKIRVQGPLSNMVEFGEAYRCPLGSAMNPTKKVLVW